MAELLVRSTNTTHADSVKDQRGCWKRGMIVAVYPDGTIVEPIAPNTPFIVIRVPTVSVANVLKYAKPDYDPTDIAMGVRVPAVIRRRRWIVRWADLPLAARNKLIAVRELIIAVPAYAGTRDYTWAQVKQYFRDQNTGLDETADL